MGTNFSLRKPAAYICGIYNLKMEAASSSEVFVVSTKLHDVTSRKTVIYIVAAAVNSSAVCITYCSS
jgi:hypothetical protein